jgi:hypothetical protein
VRDNAAQPTTTYLLSQSLEHGRHQRNHKRLRRAADGLAELNNASQSRLALLGTGAVKHAVAQLLGLSNSVLPFGRGQRSQTHGGLVVLVNVEQTQNSEIKRRCFGRDLIDSKSVEVYTSTNATLNTRVIKRTEAGEAQGRKGDCAGPVCMHALLPLLPLLLPLWPQDCLA